MVKQTTNLKLNMPEGTDRVEIDVLNANMEILDKAVPSKVDKVAGKQLSTEDYTTAEKTKLGGIADGAQVNVIEGVTVNGSAVPMTGKTADVTVPTKVSDLTNDADYAKVSQIPTKVSTLQNDADYAKVSQIPTKVGDLTNDSGFITKAVADLANYYVKTDTYTRSEVLELVNAIPKFTVTVVDSLPASGDQATIYFVPVPGKGQNVHDEYIWVNGAWEQIGSTAFELDIVQDASGIKINGTALQGASATQDGLLTKGAYATFNAKQPAGDYLARDADGYTRGKLWFDAETWFSKPINIGAGTYKIDTNGQAILSWIKLAGTTDLNAVPPKYPVLRNDGWVYSRTLAEMITDLGIDGKQPAGDYALRSEIPDISGKADKSEIPDISGKLDKSGGTMTGPLNINGGDGKGINIPQDGTINGPGTATLFGFLSNVFTVGSGTWPTNIRGQGARPTYNNAEMALKSDIPVNVSQLTNDAKYATTSELPTKVGDLTNDSGFITKAVSDLTNYYTRTQTYTRGEIENLVSAIPKFKYLVVDSLPTAGEDATVYLTPKAGEGKDVHDEYIWVNGAFELIGSTAFNLTIKQDATGITINEQALQDATATQDGLMTKEAFNSLGKKAEDSATVHKGGAEEVSGNKAFMGGLTTPDLTNDELMNGNAVAPAPQIMTVVQQALNGKASTSAVQTAQNKADSAYDLANGKASQSDLTTLTSRVTALERIPNANGRSY